MNLSSVWYRLQAFFEYYNKASTVYQVHSPKIFGWAMAVLENHSVPECSAAITRIRQRLTLSEEMVEHCDLGTGNSGVMPLRKIVARSASSNLQGRRLFRTAAWRKPATILELGSSTGIGTAWLAAAAPEARTVGLEGCPHCARLATENLLELGLKRVSVLCGDINDTLPGALKQIGTVDLVFFDGNHREATTLQYFNQCLEYAGPDSVFIFDDIYWSAGMTAAWQKIQQHPRVRCTIDCYDQGLVFFNPDFLEVQHFVLLPRRWKPWKI